jgi:hypothetical protein
MQEEKDSCSSLCTQICLILPLVLIFILICLRLTDHPVPVAAIWSPVFAFAGLLFCCVCVCVACARVPEMEEWKPEEDGGEATAAHDVEANQTGQTAAENSKSNDDGNGGGDGSAEISPANAALGTGANASSSVEAGSAAQTVIALPYTQETANVTHVADDLQNGDAQRTLDSSGKGRAAADLRKAAASASIVQVVVERVPPATELSNLPNVVLQD